MFNPTEIIFAVTNACNLACTHCNVSRNNKVLDVQAVRHLLTECREFNIDRIGFSGGEPFLVPNILIELIVLAREQELLFDRIMTNGIWYSNKEELDEVLCRIFEAGYDGTVCVSFDAYHQQKIDKIALFIESVQKASGNKESVELACVFNEDPGENKARLEELAECLFGVLEDDAIPYRIVDDHRQSQEAQGVFDGTGLYVPITHIKKSVPGDSLSWNDAEWFTDDFCEGPGNVLYVHADGRIAVCCGFANEQDQLIVGTIENTLAELIMRAESSTYINYCYERGLGALRKELEKKGYHFKGKTRDLCGFCDYVCRNNLEKLVGPPGFEPGTNGL